PSTSTAREAAMARGISHIWVRPFADDALTFDALDVARMAAEAIVVVMTVDRAVPNRMAPIPSIQRPSLADWRISPASFALNPQLLVGQDACESIVPSNLSTREFRFHQIVRQAPVDSGARTNLPGRLTAAFLYEYRMGWQPIGHGLGQVAYSLPLAPCESVNIAVVDWSRRDVASRNEDLSVQEQLLHNLHRDRSIEETIDT